MNCSKQQMVRSSRMNTALKLFFFTVLVSSFSYAASETCSYIIRIKTGCQLGAGTDAVVSVVFKNASARQGQLLGPSVVSFYNLNNLDRSDFERCSSDVFLRNGRCVNNIDTMEIFFDNSGETPEWYLEFVEVEVRLGNQVLQIPTRFVADSWLHARHQEDTFTATVASNSNIDAAELAAFETALLSLQKAVQASLVSDITAQIDEFLGKKADPVLTPALERALTGLQAPNITAAQTLEILQEIITTVHQSCVAHGAACPAAK